MIIIFNNLLRYELNNAIPFSMYDSIDMRLLWNE